MTNTTKLSVLPLSINNWKVTSWAIYRIFSTGDDLVLGLPSFPSYESASEYLRTNFPNN